MFPYDLLQESEGEMGSGTGQFKHCKQKDKKQRDRNEAFVIMHGSFNPPNKTLCNVFSIAWLLLWGRACPL